MSVSSSGEPENGMYVWVEVTHHNCGYIKNSDNIIVPMDSIHAIGREHEYLHTYRMRRTPIDFECVTG